MGAIYDNRFKFTYQVAWQKIKEKELFYIYDITNDKSYHFNDVSYFILCGIEAHCTINEIAENISSLYEIDDSILKSDIKKFINQVIKKGMVMKYEECI